MPLKSIPNILSGVRLLVALVFPFLAEHLRIIFLALAFLTEYLDGALARKYNWLTPIGQILDPLADKLITLSVGLTFVAANKILLTELTFISLRDITAGLGFLVVIFIYKTWALEETSGVASGSKLDPKLVKKFKPNFFGKMTTVFQYLVFFNILFFSSANTWLILATGILSLIAAGLYIFNFYRAIKRD